MMKLKHLFLVTMMLLFGSVSLFAATSGDWEYEFYIFDGQTITKYNGSAENVTVPDSLGGRTIKRIGNSAFEGNETVKKVTVPSTLTSIGNNTFEGCKNLTSVTYDTGFIFVINSTSVYLPSGVTAIGESAFRRCESLRSVTIPPKVKVISKFAFAGCYDLTTVYVPTDSVLTTIGEQAFQSCGELRQFSAPNILSILGTNSFILPQGLTTIEFAAFNGCWNVTSLSIPDSVSTIEYAAFSQCAALSLAKFYGDVPENFGTPHTNGALMEPAPSVFNDTAADFVIQYYAGKAGWMTPSWNGYSTVELGSSSGGGSGSGDDSGPTVIAPTIVGNPISQTVDVYSSVTFTVSAEGSSPLSYQWMKNGQPLVGSTSSSFTIGSVNGNHEGDYYCRVSNSAGSVDSAIATLTVSNYEKIPLYRFARNDNPSHFFTASEEEKDIVLAELGDYFSLEGISQFVVASQMLNAVPVYRMYNSLSGAHFYTASAVERDHVLATLDYFTLEGVAFYVFLTPELGTFPVYRFYVPETGSHFFTISEAEKNFFISSGQTTRQFEGVAWYAFLNF